MKHKRKFLALGILALMILPYITVSQAMAVSAARTTEDEVFSPRLKAILNVTYTTTTASGFSVSGSKLVLTAMSIHKAVTYDIIPDKLHGGLALQDLNSILDHFTTEQLLSGLDNADRHLGFATLGFPNYALIPQGKEINLDVGKHGDAHDQYAVDDMAPGIIRFSADNDTYGYKYTTATVLDIPDQVLTSGKYYYLHLYGFQTVSTAANSVVYIGWENASNLATVYDSGHVNLIMRGRVDYWFYINVSARPSGTNAKITALKFENIEFTEFALKERDEPLSDHRDVQILYGSKSIFAYSIQVKGSWIDNFVANVAKIPASVEQTWEGVSSAWGWENLDDSVRAAAQAALKSGQTLQDYAVQTYQFVVKSGQNVGESIKKTIDDVAKSTAPSMDATLQALDKVKQDVVHSVSIGIDISSKALDGLVSEAGTAAKGAVDTTNGLIAGVAKTVSGAGEFVIDGINGLVDAGGKFVDGAVGVFNSIGSWFNQWWWLIIIGLVIGVFLIILVVISLANSRAAEGTTIVAA